MSEKIRPLSKKAVFSAIDAKNGFFTGGLYFKSISYQLILVNLIVELPILRT